MTTQKIPFGLLNGRMVSPSDVPRGLACGCVCAECKGRLVAKHPTKNIVKHFSHHNSESCAGGFETALHKAAKQVILDNKEILLPELNASTYLTDIETRTHVEKQKTITPRMVKLDSVVDESRDYQGVIPDIVAIVRDKLLFIEIAVTHFVDQEKLEKLKTLGHATLEIDLSDSPRIPTMDDIKRLVIHTATNRKWLINSKQKELEERVHNDAKAELELGISAFKAKKIKEAQEIQRYKQLSDKDKFNEDLTAMRATPERVSRIAGHKVKCDFSILAPTKTWQLSIFRQFVYRQGGWNDFDTSDVYKWVSERFRLKLSDNFEDAPKIAIYYYLQTLVELKLIEKGYGRGSYVVVGNKNLPD